MIVKNFVLLDQDGNEFDLYKNLDVKVLLIFYPGDGTFICSRQLADYSSNLYLFQERGIKLAGINIAGRSSHKSFCEKSGINFPLLADTKKDVSRVFNAINVFGINKRKLVLINEDRKIVFDKSFFSLNYYNTGQVLKIIDSLKV